MGHQPSKERKDSPRTPVSILLVDDTPAKLLTYEVMLGELGEKLIKAGSVEEAFAVLLKSDVALVITDVAMPSVDGFEFAKQLREHPRFESTPIIFVSAMAHSERDQLHGYASGAVDYVTAPIFPEVLRAKVKVFADLYRKQRELEALKAELETRVAARTSELAASEARYRSLVDGANDIVATLDLEFRFTSVNPAVERVLGYAPEEVVGTSLGKFVPEDQLAVYADMLKRKLQGNQSTQYEMRLLAKDGNTRVTLEVSSKLMFDGEGRPVGIHSISRDITERKEAEARQLVLIRELQHRTKNLIAVVQSIATNARSSDLSSANAALVGRLHALAHAQEFVASGPAGGVPLRDLIEAELSAFATRFEVEGIPLIVGGAFAQQFALVVHELATNAAKYGALSTPRGRLLIAWHIDEVGEEPNLNFSWVERDGPPVKVPAEEGFGTRLISASLNGTSSVSYAETGLEFRADVPLSQIMFGKHGSG
jgi:PAS domain S-box-containing protein